jgi:exopolysaccharide biosynthesis polyprenyl glycosylphosphotransferase
MLAKLNKKKLSVYFCGALIISDFLAVVIAFILSYVFRFYSGLFSTPFGIPAPRHYIFPLLFVEFLLIYIVNTRGLYKPTPVRKFIDQGFPLIKSVCITMIFLLAATFFYRAMTYSRLLFFIIWVILALLLIFSRYLLHILYIKKILPKVRKKIILVGKPESIESLKKHHSYFNHYGKICGCILSRKHGQVEQSIKNLGHIEDFEHILDLEKPDEVVLVDLELPRRRVMDMILEAEKRMVIFKIIADLFDIMIQQFELESTDGLNLVKIKESPLNFAYNRFIKRTMDVIGSALGLVVLSPVFLIVTILIKLDSKGAIFFVQDRVSEGGGLFKIYKFRTMLQDAEKNTGPVFVKKDDMRCTKIGRFLRKYNIDELPQLFNVFRGEMSLVGPRPERPYFVEQFKEDIPRYMSRHHIKSGITGWAQVNGLRQSTPIEERVKYDLYYAENWSIWLDLKIIFLSFFALKNAY